MDSAGHHCGDALAEGVDLEVVHCPVEGVDFLGIESSDEFGEVLVEVVLDDAVLEFGGLLDVVLEGVEDLQDEVKGLLVDIGDRDLGKAMCTVCPFSMASASPTYFMIATCCSLRLYSFPSTITSTIILRNQFISRSPQNT